LNPVLFESVEAAESLYFAGDLWSSELSLLLLALLEVRSDCLAARIGFVAEWASFPFVMLS